MRAIALSDFESKPVLMDLPVPEPEPGEALVRVRTASVNGFDLAVISGMLKEIMEHRFPVVLGKDFAGRVEAIGEGVSSVALGDEVFGAVTKPYLGDGSFAEFVTIPESLGLAKIPNGLGLETAGALGLTGTAAAMSMDALAPREGESLLISGATGGVGAQAVQLAAKQGAEVIATARPGNEADFVRGLGANHTVDYSGDLRAELRAVRPGGVDAALHLAGDGLQLANLVVPGGRMVSTLGLGPDQVSDLDLSAISIMATPDAPILDRVGAAVASGAIRVPIQETYELEDVPKAFEKFAGGTLGKIAVRVSE
jgi:NADPH:quinone reductase-like Zn-dependent oxidoreductase